MRTVRLRSTLGAPVLGTVMALGACSGGGGSPPSGGGGATNPPTTAPTSGATATPSNAPTMTPTPRASGAPTGSASATPSPAPTATPTSGANASAPVIAGCQVFPSDNAFNQDISSLPVDANSATYLASMNASSRNLHPDFGSDLTYGIPYVVVASPQPFVPINFTAYGDQSDPGPYPIPSNAPIEGGSNSTGDRHVLVLDSTNCTIYEMYNSHYTGPGWNADSGAVFPLNTDALRPDGWTSADAAGLPILPGLVRYDETMSGAIHHAIRMTVHATQNGYIHPATHDAGSANTSVPPMGLRIRLKASYDISGFNSTAQTILTAMKHYGLIIADNGSDFYFTGAPDARWNDNDLDALKNVPGSAFEVVQAGTILH